MTVSARAWELAPQLCEQWEIGQLWINPGGWLYRLKTGLCGIYDNLEMLQLDREATEHYRRELQAMGQIIERMPPDEKFFLTLVEAIDNGWWPLSKRVRGDRVGVLVHTPLSEDLRAMRGL